MEWLGVFETVPWLGPTVAGVYGAVFASFLGVVADRVPAGRSIQGRSFCVCGRQLRWWENIPVVSWAVLAGRAACCASPIPARYVATELSLGGVWASAALWLPWPAAAAVMLASCAALLALCWQRESSHSAGTGQIDGGEAGR